MKVLIIGGGPAGMMAANSALSCGNEVTIIERNEKLGKKLFITGKGRCNVTNYCSVNEFLTNVVSNSKFLISALNNFTPQDTFDFIEKNGVKLKVERGNRVFPESDKSSDIIKALTPKNADVMLNVDVKELIVSDGVAKGVITGDGKKILADKVIFATGGASYPATGSDGTAFSVLKKVGHTVTELKPALSALISHDGFIKDLEGLSLRNVGVSLTTCGKTFSEFGEMLFTSRGISGPVVLTLSSLANAVGFSNAKAVIDLKPALTTEQLDARVLRDFSENSNKCFKNSLNDLLPKSLIPVVIARSGIDPEIKVNQIGKAQRVALVELLKNFTVNISGADELKYAIVTKGGISTKEINPKTMESKLVKGLFFAGEVIDVDALTGGFNIQIALATGFVAGKNQGE